MSDRLERFAELRPGSVMTLVVEDDLVALEDRAARQEAELESYRNASEENAAIETVHQLLEELEVEPGGSLVEAVNALREHRDELEAQLAEMRRRERRIMPEGAGVAVAMGEKEAEEDRRAEPKDGDIKERLLNACHGHPYAKIPWPHRLLHEARRRIEELENERDRVAQLGIQYRNQRDNLVGKLRKAIEAGEYVVALCEADVEAGRSPNPAEKSDPNAALAHAYAAMNFLPEARQALTEVEKESETANGGPLHDIEAHEKYQECLTELQDIALCIGTTRYMDPHDGGNPSLAEQVKRMKADVDQCHDQRDDLWELVTHVAGHLKVGYEPNQIFEERLEETAELASQCLRNEREVLRREALEQERAAKAEERLKDAGNALAILDAIGKIIGIPTNEDVGEKKGAIFKEVARLYHQAHRSKEHQDVIAAALELVEALEEVPEAYTGRKAGGSETANKARAALAKAYGEDQG